MDIYEEIVKLRRDGRKGALATIINVRGSIPSFETAKMLVRDDGSIAGTIGGGCVEAEVWQAAREVMEDTKPRTLSFNLNQNPKYDTGLVCGGTLEVFIEPVLPVPVLYLFGAGHVALNVYKVARVAGFDVVVVDDRETYASRDRFPEAREIVAEDFDRATAQLAPGESSFIVIVTRGHRDDMRVLRWAVEHARRLHRHDRFQAQGGHDIPRTGKGRHGAGEIRPGTRTHRPRHRGGHAGGDRCGRGGGDDRVPPSR